MSASQAHTHEPGEPRVDPRRDALCGRLLGGRFRVEALVAQGGMGRVYRAVQLPLGRQVALKVVSPQGTPAHLSTFHRRFLLEASIQARLCHPNHVTLYDFGRHPPNIFFLAMEYLTGISLRLALLRERAFVAPRAVHVAIGIARAVHEAHGLGALHRDLKPANVFLERRGGDPNFVKVLDFGLVKRATGGDGAEAELTQPGHAMGSPGYMAPEQIRGERCGPPCDVYALGVMLYEMLAGQPPFVRTGAAETMMAHVHDAPSNLCATHPRRRIPSGLGAVVHRCLAKAPSARPPTMAALLTALAPWSGWDDTVAEVAPTGESGWDAGPHSEWSVVSTTGILARPPAPGGEASTQIWRPPPRRRRRAAPRRRALPSVRRPPPAPRWRRAAGGVALALVATLAAWRYVTAWAPPGTVRLTTQPPGAEAFVNGQLSCAATPCELPWRQLPGAGASRRLTVRFVLPGHHEHVTAKVARGRWVDVGAQLSVAHSDGGATPP